MNHAMIDLETLGVGPRAAILTIGWAYFDTDNFEVGPSGKIQVDVQSCIERGMVVNDSTFRWWLQQSDEARSALQTQEAPQIDDVLELFRSELIGRDIKYVWGNGANFDISILETAYELCKIEAPWEFYNVRCYRTVKNLFPNVPRVTPDVPHCAAADARAQAQHLVGIYREFQA